MAVQKSLFPATIQLSAPDAVLLQSLLPELKVMGYEIESLADNSFIIQGVPSDILQGDEYNAIELLLEQYKHLAVILK